MINGIGKVTQSLNEKLQKWQSFFCFTRGIDFQREATIEFECIYNEALSLKSKAIELEDEDTANLMLCLEKFIVCLINELKMWISIKEGNSHEAWNCLVVAQSAGRCALSAHHTGVTYEAHILRLELIEKIIFPPMVFFSPGIVVRKEQCSICGLSYDECDHILGRPYMGQMCYRIISSMDITEVSIVDEPANKMARAISIKADGVSRDYLTWYPKNEAQQDN